MSSDAPMKYVSPRLRDLYRILQFQELWKSDLFGALLACDKFRRGMNT